VALLEREIAAAAVLRECEATLARRGSTIIREVVGATQGDIVDWRHYPDGEVYDPNSHAQYFYHCHGPSVRDAAGPPDEHGHFHLFLRGEGVPAGVTPLLLPELAVAGAPAPRQSAPLKRGASAEVCHLVAIAIDAESRPLRLFTTNRWVTGETWYKAEDVIGMLGRWRITGDGPSALLNRWLGALLTLYHHDIAALLRERDAAVMQRRWRWRGNVFEDTRLEITASRTVDLDARLAAIAERGRAAIAPRGTRAPRPLPRLADGWGS